MKVAGLRSVKARIDLSGNNDGPFLAQRLDELDRALAAHGKGKNGVGKENRVAHGKDRNPALVGCARILAGWIGRLRSSGTIKH